MTTTYRVIRDGADLVWVFEAVAGLEAFGHAERGRVFVRGVKGDRMPGDVACDWLRDQGVEPVRAF